MFNILQAVHFTELFVMFFYLAFVFTGIYLLTDYFRGRKK